MKLSVTGKKIYFNESNAFASKYCISKNELH